MEYTVITKRGLWDIVRECMTEEEEAEEQKDREALTEEQNDILKQTYGENWYTDSFYMVRHKSRWINKDYSMFCDIDDIINMLAIKDGVDLVRFENGNLGYVAYYNGMEDIVEIVAKVEDIEKFIIAKGGNDVEVETITEEVENVVFHSLKEIAEHIDNYYC